MRGALSTTNGIIDEHYENANDDAVEEIFTILNADNRYPLLRQAIEDAADGVENGTYSDVEEGIVEEISTFIT
eukprot:2798020-Prymnesium_polylepis.1